MNYQTFSNLHFRLLLKNSFPIVHIDLKDTRSKSTNFAFVGFPGLFLTFRKASIILFFEKHVTRWLL